VLMGVGVWKKWWAQVFDTFFSFWWYWGLNSGPRACQAGTLPLESHPSLFALVCFSDRVVWIPTYGMPLAGPQTCTP
jgi:hypothetical protein